MPHNGTVKRDAYLRRLAELQRKQRFHNAIAELRAIASDPEYAHAAGLRALAEFRAEQQAAKEARDG